MARVLAEAAWSRTSWTSPGSLGGDAGRGGGAGDGLQGHDCSKRFYPSGAEFPRILDVGVGQEMTTKKQPDFRPHAEGQPEDGALERFPLEERILVVLAQLPWASASNLAARLDLSRSDIHKACHELEGNRLIAGRELGVTRRIQRRYVLARQGVMHVTKPFQHQGQLRAALPLTWQMTEDGATRMLSWLPMIESLYEILPTFWTSGLAVPYQWQSIFLDPAFSSHVWLGQPTLTVVTWLPRGRLHAAATWRFERYDKRPRDHSIPFLWYGLRPQEDYRSRSLRLGSPFIRCPRKPNNPIWWDIDPPVVAIGLDEFAAFRSRTAYGHDVQVGAVSTAGALAWSAEASHSAWAVSDTPPRGRSIGHPEAAAIGEGPDLVNLGGMREYRLLAFLSEFRGATRANLVKAFHMSSGAATTVLNRLEDRGLVTNVDINLYLTQKGLAMLADRDRVDVDRLVEVTYPDPEGEDATRERRHDSAVAAVAAAFREAGMTVAAGWRRVVSWHDGQLVPDLWVRLPVPAQEQGAWVPVEVEFSAKTERRIQTEKLRSYRLAQVRLKTFPLLVITGEASAATLFDDLAGDLPMLTTTLQEFLTGVWEGPESVWRRRGRPVGVSDIAREHQPHLWQRTGRSLDYSKPSPEVWERLAEEELICADPGTGPIGGYVPPMSPELRAATDRVLNEAKAGPAATNPASAPTPPPAPTAPTAPTAPVSRAPTAQDQARQRSVTLSRIDRLVATADTLAGVRLERSDLTEEERLCLGRVRAIITYGAIRHYRAEERLVEESLQRCLMLEDKHRHACRARDLIWSLTVSRTQTVPGQAFRDLLKDQLKGQAAIRRDAYRKFDNWSKMVDRAARASRQARTLESGGPSSGSAT